MSKKILAILTLSLFIQAPLFAAAFDRIGAGPRAKGMGDAFTGVADDISSMYWNPAGLAMIKKKYISVMQRDLYNLGLINHRFLGYAQPGLGKGIMAFGLTRLSTTPEIKFIEYSENTFICSYGNQIKKLSKKLYLGLSLKYYYANFGYGKATGYAFDAGAKYNLNRRWILGLAGQDINRPIIRWDTGTKETLESNYRMGLAYNAKTYTFAFDLDRLSESKPATHVGLEKWFLKKSFALRAGAFTPYEAKWSTTFGATLNMKKYDIDYGYELHPNLGSSHLFALGMKF